MQSTTLHQTMERHYHEWQQSGLSQIGYCTLHGIGFAKFNYWVRKFRSEKGSDAVSGFLSVSVSSPATPILEVTRRDGHILRFYHGADVDFVNSLLG